MTDSTLSPETIIATASANLRASVERPQATLRQRIRQHRKSEPCPSLSVDDRSWPLAMAGRALAEMLQRPSTSQFSELVKLVVQLIQLRLALLLADLADLNAIIAAHRTEQTTSATIRDEALRDLRRAMIYAQDLQSALDELQRSGAHLPGVMSGQTCATCLREKQTECVSGWRYAPTPEKPRRFLECENRARLNNREPTEHTP
jgi:hypothetical protein